MLDRAAADTAATLGAAPRIVRLALDGELLLDGSAARLALVFASLLTRVATSTPGGDAILMATRRLGSDAVVTMAHGQPDSLPVGAGPVHASCPLGHLAELRFPGFADTALLKRMVQLHGGQLRVGCVHQPASVEIRLPSAPAHDHSGRDVQAQWATAFPPCLRVLVVDRNVDAAEVLGMLLNLLGISTRVADRAADAIVLLETYLPDVVILDIDLPASECQAVIECIREVHAVRTVLVIALACRHRHEELMRFHHSEFDRCLAKPAEIGELLQTLRGFGTAAAKA